MKYYKFTVWFSGLQEKKFEWLEEAECTSEAFANALKTKALESMGLSLNDAKEIRIVEVS